jgi:hypothetical protein
LSVDQAGLVLPDLATFHVFLTIETVLSPWESFQPTGIYVVTAGYTNPEHALLDSAKCGFDAAYHDPPFATLVEECLLGNAHHTLVR